MGSLLSSSNQCGIDSFSSVDSTINSLVFSPPSTNDEKIITQMLRLKAMAKKVGIKVQFLKTENKNGKISMIKCNPLDQLFTKYIIFSHGNASNIYHMGQYLIDLAQTYKICVICYDYPGYGKSKGPASEQNSYESLKSCVSYVVNGLMVNPQDIILIGQSLGTGITVHYAAEVGWKSPIILISPYKSVPRVLSDSFMIDWLVAKYRFNTIDKIDKLVCPVKIFHGKLDTVISISHGEDLYNKLPNKSLNPVWIEDADHNDILDKIKVEDFDEVFNFKL